jgi:predicted lipoprotein with Yx(FWY)xxD motif
MTRNNPITFLASLAALPLVALALAACGSASASPAPPTTASGNPATVGVANTSIGKILVNSQGRTLYLFQKDSGTRSACTGACARTWPPLLVSGKPTPGSGATASLLGISIRSAGKRQVTYNGHPLYLFADDQKAGDTNGQGINAFGGTWFALSAAGARVTASPPSSSGGAGGGY